jgi:CheY-like chemotaxis protein
VLSVNIESTEGFQLLSMLKLDPGTEHIPVVTYTTSGSEEDTEDDEFETDRPVQTPHIPMRLH